jgi:hypothetical protein
VAAFFGHTWAVHGYLHEQPSFLNYFRAGEILAIFAYMMAFGLFESLAVTMALVFLGSILPLNWIRTDLQPLNALKIKKRRRVSFRLCMLYA